jgi:hypothetical protein
VGTLNTHDHAEEFSAIGLTILCRAHPKTMF